MTTNMIHLLYTITIKSHVSFCPPARKIPHSPSILYAPQPSPYYYQTRQKKISFDDWIQNLAHFLNNLI